eukprot:1605377-Rhodomonas_salina.1
MLSWACSPEEEEAAAEGQEEQEQEQEQEGIWARGARGEPAEIKCIPGTACYRVYWRGGGLDLISPARVGLL